jgi:DNA-binding response OmpR family regulator
VTAPEANPRRLILVVDDEPFMLEMVARVLREGGYDVEEAPHGLAAKELLQRGELTPDLVLTDLKMPHMDGFQLGRVVAERWPAVPMAYMSGYGAEAESILPADLLTRCFIAKPFSPGELLELVDRCIRPVPVP